MIGPSFSEALVDERAIGVQLVLAFVFIMAISLALAVMWGPTMEIRDASYSNADGTTFEEHSDEGIGYTWDAFLALPVIGAFLIAVWVLVNAIILSSVG